MDQQFKPLSAGLYRLKRAQIIGGKRVNGAPPKVLRNLGDYDNLTLNLSTNQTKIYGNDFATQMLRRTITTLRTGVITFGARQDSAIVKDLTYMASSAAVTQAMNHSETVSGLLDLKVGDIIPTGVLLPLNTSTLVNGVDPDDVSFTLGTHFKLSVNGRAEIIALPDDYDPETASVLTVNGPAAAVDTVERAVMTTNDTPMWIEVHQIDDDDTGTPIGDALVFPWVNANADGDVALGSSSTDPGVVSIKMDIQIDTDQPSGRQTGWARPMSQPGI